TVARLMMKGDEGNGSQNEATKATERILRRVGCSRRGRLDDDMERPSLNAVGFVASFLRFVSSESCNCRSLVMKGDER
ncbi:MAG TPA: hypothetical protein VNC21_06830, partial [Vicinamibacterales bacterium]|nr:hypothetical protein [Vicinamibacterales bacterium]